MHLERFEVSSLIFRQLGVSSFLLLLNVGVPLDADTFSVCVLLHTGQWEERLLVVWYYNCSMESREIFHSSGMSDRFSVA